MCRGKKTVLKKNICEENYNFMNKPENVYEEIQGLMVKSMSMKEIRNDNYGDLHGQRVISLVFTIISNFYSSPWHIVMLYQIFCR